MGHALDHTLMDALTRRKRMQGYEVLWLPGMDHAGIATQTRGGKATRRRRQDQRGLRPRAVHRQGVGLEARIRRHHRRPDAPRSATAWTGAATGSPWTTGLSRAVRTIFKRLYDAGLIYQAERLVNWSPVLETAISDLEVKYEDVEGELVSFRYGSLDDARAAHRRRHHPGRDDARATPRSPCIPTTSATGHLVGTTLPHPFLDREHPDRRRRARRPRIRHRRSQSHARARSRTTSRSGCGTTCRCRR